MRRQEQRVTEPGQRGTESGLMRRPAERDGVRAHAAPRAKSDRARAERDGVRAHAASRREGRSQAHAASRAKRDRARAERDGVKLMRRPAERDASEEFDTADFAR